MTKIEDDEYYMWQEEAKLSPSITIWCKDSETFEEIKNRIILNQRIIDALLQCYSGAVEEKQRYQREITETGNMELFRGLAEASGVESLILELFNGEENIKRMLRGNFQNERTLSNL